MSSRLRRLTGYLLLGVFFATFGASLSAGHLGGQDDALCVVSERGSGPATIKSKAATTSPGHCAVCHWVRAVAGAASFGPMAALPLVTAQRLDTTVVTSRSRESVFSQSSPRAPPVSSLS
jgi:mono/diheme cytochrome c family protein